MFGQPHEYQMRTLYASTVVRIFFRNNNARAVWSGMDLYLSKDDERVL